MAPDRIRPRVWLAALLICGGTAAMAVSALQVAEKRGRAPGTRAAGGAAAEAAPLLQLARGKALLPDTLEGLVDVYVSGAGDPSAQGARTAALGAILREPDPQRRLYALLAALAGDPTEPGADPLWRQATEGLSRIWQGDRVHRGLDLMVMEARPRARQAVASSFAHLATSGAAQALPVGERVALANNFIDLYGQWPGMQKTEVQQALRALGNGDAADILQGKSLASDDGLEANRAYQHALEQSVHTSAVR